jgi:hypothetical protein
VGGDTEKRILLGRSMVNKEKIYGWCTGLMDYELIYNKFKATWELFIADLEGKEKDFQEVSEIMAIYLWDATNYTGKRKRSRKDPYGENVE